MNAGLLTAASFAAAVSGFLALGLAMDRHYEDSFGRGREPGRRRPWMRAAGAVALLVSLAVCCHLRGAAQGWVLWFGVLTAGAWVVVLVMSYAPRRATGLAMAAGAVALAALACAGC
ncbi:DUF3325 domain-containing protein [Sphingomonas sp. NCPPB 2930]